MILESDMNKVAATLLIALYSAALFAGFLSPYSPHQEFREHFFQPPTQIHFRDSSGRWTHPYVGESYLIDPTRHVFLEGSPVYVTIQATELNLNPYIAEAISENLTVTLSAENGRELGKITYFKETGENTSVFVGMTVLNVASGLNSISVTARSSHPIVSISSEPAYSPSPVHGLSPKDHSMGITQTTMLDMSQHRIHFFVHGETYKLLGFIPCSFHLFGTDRGHIFILGSDQSGRDIFSRTLYAARVSLTIAIICVLVTSFLGWLVGSIAGFHGGRTDMILMRVTEVIMAVPTLYLILAVRNIFPLHLDFRVSYLVMIAVLSLTGWAAMSRIIRGMVLALREEQFILAVKSQGATFSRILIHHLMPATAGFVIVRATLLIPIYILSEAALSFLGVGIQEPTPTWGNMLAVAQDIRVLTQFPWTLAPGAVLFLAVLAFNFLGEGFRRKFAPRQF